MGRKAPKENKISILPPITRQIFYPDRDEENDEGENDEENDEGENDWNLFRTINT